ncbi:transcription factor [Candidatus Woesearchaeota archaeon]|nr:transcription factor [Candidatus Woesearchaeota archaeon]MBI2581578.1 transcription factor [Candidatus Woesearchaeota archaeon]
MRLTQKKIEEIMLSILGEEGLSLIKELSGKQNVSEFELADKLKKDIKIVRKMLYLLYNHNLVSFIRKKDKIKGWYIYYWTLQPESIKFSYIKRKKELLAKLQQRLEEESRELYFTCPNKCVRLNFDQAMDFEFHCPECGELLSQEDNTERIETLRKKVSEIETELEELMEKRKVRKIATKARKKEVKVRKREKQRKKATTRKAAKPKLKKITKKKK